MARRDQNSFPPKSSGAKLNQQSDFSSLFEDVVESVRVSDEFLAYRGQAARLSDRLRVDYLPKLEEDFEYRRVELAQELMEERSALLRAAGRFRANRGSVLLALTIVAATASAVTGWAVANVAFDPLVIFVILGSMSLVAGIALLIANLRNRQRFRTARSRVQELAALTDDQMREWLEVSVAAAYSSTIAAVLAEEGLVDFPRFAPRLVELEIDGIVPSRAIDRVLRFVLDHDTSAIGITGPRGSGKSTLLQAVKRDIERRAGRAIVIPSPVHHDPVDLLRLLAQAIQEDQVGGVASRIRQEALLENLRRRSRSRAATLGGAGLFSLGILLFVLSLRPSIAKSIEDALNVPWLTWVALALAVAGLAVVLMGLRPFSAQRGLWHTRPTGLEELVDDLNYERMTGSSLGGKAGSGVEISAELQTSRTAREVTHARLVTDLRSELQTLGAASKGPIFIAIDELDKLPSKKDLLATVNTLKDLLHLRNVHVALTLSEDALNSFELRQTHERDAFDSTFDVVVDVDRLDEADARRVIESRVAGFPSPLASACYVWSAGIPRDLLRHARACIELVKSREEVPAWYAVGLELSQVDASSKVRALMRSGVPIEECDFIQELTHLWTTRAPRSSDLDTRLPISDVAGRLCAYTAVRFACIWHIRGVGYDNTSSSTTLTVLRDAAAAAATSAALEIARRALETLE